MKKKYKTEEMKNKRIWKGQDLLLTFKCYKIVTF